MNILIKRNHIIYVILLSTIMIDYEFDERGILQNGNALRNKMNIYTYIGSLRP